MKKIKWAIIIISIVYAVLLIPESDPEEIKLAEHKQFVWDRDSLWHSLEEQFLLARGYDHKDLSKETNNLLNQLENNIHKIESQQLSPNDKLFENLLTTVFHTAPLVGASPDSSRRFIELISRMRTAVKRQSLKWDHKEIMVRNLLYKLLYGSRAAVEEIMLQSDNDSLFSQITELDEPSETPSATFMGVKIHSGDIFVSRGGAPTSALIARGSDYPGNFSHIALCYIDPKTSIPSIIESHIEIGVTVSSLEEYIKDKKLRIMVLRPRHDLPELQADPMIPHKAAEASLERAQNEHIQYDFEMNYKDYTKLFCSEVASSVYSKYGIKLWNKESTISSYGTAKILSGFGVRNFITQEPSDLEYDPKISVVAEWRDLNTLYQDHIDNAVVDAIIEWSELNNEINIDDYLLPVYRIVKLYSVILNQFNIAGPIPEGMSATSALRHEAYKSFHNQIKTYVINKANEFISKNNYIPPYWSLLRFANNYLSDFK